MHPCLSVDEILRLIARKLVESGSKATAVSLACCCKTFREPVLDILWDTQDQLIMLLKCFPIGVWKEKHGYITLQRIPTKPEWNPFQGYAQRMRNLTVDGSKDRLDQGIVPVLQLRTTDKPLLPKLENFKCENLTDSFTPFIPLFLSPRTTSIDIHFKRYSATIAVAAVISRLTTLCPSLKYIAISGLTVNPIIIDAVSEMLLACNRGSLRAFRVICPLTQEAREVLYQLPNLLVLWVLIDEHTSLPRITLPNLLSIEVLYNDDLHWLEGFRGAQFEKLRIIKFHPSSKEIGDFLETFESVALTTSAHHSLSQFTLQTCCSWNPNYYSLLAFKQLKWLEIEFSCNNGCSSRVDDDVITALAHSMPGLRVLILGRDPCQTPTGVTVNGLITLASRCPRLFLLRIHFQTASLIDLAANAMTIPPHNTPITPREDCALGYLEVGEIPVPAQSAVTVALVLLKIFPHIFDVKYTNQDWKGAADHVMSFRQIGAFVNRIGSSD